MRKLRSDINTKTFEFLQARLLKIIEENQPWMAANPTALQWLFCQWETIWVTGRACFGYEGIVKRSYECENNPKYEVADRFQAETPEIDEQECILYDAWANAQDAMKSMRPNLPYWAGFNMSLGTREDFDRWRVEYQEKLKDPFFVLSQKKNKTFEEHVELLTDKRYQYHSMYGSKFSVANHLLCVIGNGYGWNKDGYVCVDTPSDRDEAIYNGWPVHDVDDFPENCREFIREIIYCDKVQENIKVAKAHYDGLVQKMIDKHMKDHSFMKSPEFKKHFPTVTVENANEADEAMSAIYAALRKEFQDEDEVTKPRAYYPLSDRYSLILTMPDNAHESYIRACKEIAEDILAHPELYVNDRPSVLTDILLWYDLPCVKAMGITRN
jgi:hypothetical protein